MRVASETHMRNPSLKGFLNKYKYTMCSPKWQGPSVKKSRNSNHQENTAIKQKKCKTKDYHELSLKKEFSGGKMCLVFRGEVFHMFASSKPGVYYLAAISTC